MVNKRALGKGLNALITDSTDTDSETGKVIRIEVDKVLPNKLQPRKNFDEEKIEELANSIKENGLIQPIVVRKENENYEIIVGERRLKAVKKLGMKEVPAVIMDFSKDKLLELALIENVQREDLNPVEEATAYKTMLEKQMITQQKLSRRIGKSRSYLANMVRILELPETIQEHVSRGKISAGQAKALLSFKGSDAQEEMADRIIKENLTVRDIEKLSRKQNVPRGTKHLQKDPYIEELEEKLRSKYGTKVRIGYRGGRGSIRIEFYSNEELDRIIEEMM